MRAEPSKSAPVLDSYGPGAFFVVMEPDGDFPSPVVLQEGEAWVRVRAEDGLAGWVLVVDLDPSP
jgi:hypothetical protein